MCIRDRFYVAYLIACFMVWSPMRWRFPRFLKLALGGVIPLLSFFMEVTTARQVTAFLDSHDAGSAEAQPRRSSDGPIPAGNE